jgi:hypothetical protein
MERPFRRYKSRASFVVVSDPGDFARVDVQLGRLPHGCLVRCPPDSGHDGRREVFGPKVTLSFRHCPIEQISVFLVVCYASAMQVRAF